MFEHLVTKEQINFFSSFGKPSPFFFSTENCWWNYRSKQSLHSHAGVLSWVHIHIPPLLQASMLPKCPNHIEYVLWSVIFIPTPKYLPLPVSMPIAQHSVVNWALLLLLLPLEHPMVLIGHWATQTSAFPCFHCWVEVHSNATNSSHTSWATFGTFQVCNPQAVLRNSTKAIEISWVFWRKKKGQLASTHV